MRLALAALAPLAAPATTLADAIVRSQAMHAGTIAEYFVEEDRVRVALEILVVQGIAKTDIQIGKTDAEQPDRAV